MTVGSYFGKAWDLLWRYPLVFILGVFLVNMISSAASGLLLGPVMCSIMFVTLKALRGTAPEFGDIFRGFDRFVDAFLAGLIVSLILGVSFILCFLPGLFLYPFFVLTYAFVIDGGLSWDKAISASWQTASRHYGKFLGFSVLSFLIGISGILVCCVGVLVTASIATMAGAVLYADMTGTLSAPAGAVPPPTPAQA
ncbi:MAG: hypothetical protein ACM3X6_04650 [Patescibacteria group bacterium]